MENIFVYDVFLSYTISDEKIVQPIWQEMCLSGLRVFWSDATLKNKLGESWFEVVQNSLEDSQHFVLICSKDSMLSKWVQREYTAFLNNCYKPKIRRLIPILMKDYKPTDLPLFLREIEACRGDSEKSIREMIKLLGGVDIDELKSKLIQKEQENQHLHKTIEKLKIEINDITEEKENLENRINFYQNEIKNTLSKKERERNYLNNKVKELKSKIKETNQEKTKLEDDLTHCQDELKKLKYQYLRVPFNPNDLTTHEVLLRVVEISDVSDVLQILQMEKEGKNRAGAIKLITDRIKSLEITTKAKDK